MNIMLTLNGLFRIGFMSVCLIVAAVCFLIAVIDVFTKDWRYDHFKCPKCTHMHSDGMCGHFRNAKCDCDYYCKDNKKKRSKK